MGSVPLCTLSFPVSVPLVTDCSRSLVTGLAEAHLPFDLVFSLLTLFPVVIGTGGGGGVIAGPVDGVLFTGGGGGCGTFPGLGPICLPSHALELPAIAAARSLAC